MQTGRHADINFFHLDDFGVHQISDLNNFELHQMFDLVSLGSTDQSSSAFLVPHLWQL